MQVYDHSRRYVVKRVLYMHDGPKRIGRDNKREVSDMIMFTILMLVIFGKMIGLAFRAAWGLTGVFFGLIFLPVILIGLAIAGFMYLAWPILMIVGLIMLVKRFAVAA